MRKKPYTEIGIKRKRCYRCGRVAGTQWQICSDGNVYRPLCIECDIELNDMVLRWMGVGDEEREEKMDKYRKRLLG